MDKKFNITIYTDGSCSHNGEETATGGWSYIIKYGQHEKSSFGYESHTTNNRMELRAVIEALKVLKSPCEIVVCTDSKYVCANAQQIKDIRARGWKTKSGSAFKNTELWQELITVANNGKHHLVFKHIEAHASDKDNNRCDAMAKNAWKARSANGVIVK